MTLWLTIFDQVCEGHSLLTNEMGFSPWDNSWRDHKSSGASFNRLKNSMRCKAGTDTNTWCYFKILKLQF